LNGLGVRKPGERNWESLDSFFKIWKGVGLVGFCFNQFKFELTYSNGPTSVWSLVLATLFTFWIKITMWSTHNYVNNMAFLYFIR